MSGKAQNDVSKVVVDNRPAKRMRDCSISSKHGVKVWDKKQGKFVTPAQGRAKLYPIATLTPTKSASNHGHSSTSSIDLSPTQPDQTPATAMANLGKNSSDELHLCSAVDAYESRAALDSDSRDSALYTAQECSGYRHRKPEFSTC